jgi:ribose transport system permease protein
MGTSTQRTSGSTEKVRVNPAEQHKSGRFSLPALHDVEIGKLLAKQGILIAFAIAMVIFTMASDRFLSLDNFSSVIRQASIIGIMAIGVTIVVISGHLDLSVGSMLSFATILVVDLHDKIGAGPAMLVSFALTLGLGLINGVLVGVLRLNALIVTLGMLSAIQGFTLIYSGGKNADIVNQAETWFSIFGRGEVAGIGVPIFLFIGLAILFELLLRGTNFGRRIYAIGSNRSAAVYSGIDRARTVMMAYLISAFCTWCAAIVMGSRVMGSQNTVGKGYELLVLAGIIVGGASLLGGSGNITKTVIGVLLLGFIQNGLLLIGYSYWTQWLVTWVVIIVAVWLDVAARRGRFLSPHA